jgi:hypothetical protein
LHHQELKDFNRKKKFLLLWAFIMSSIENEEIRERKGFEFE